MIETSASLSGSLYPGSISGKTVMPRPHQFTDGTLPHQLFEGMKVTRGDDGRLRFFRPELNMRRMSKSAKRACLPVRWNESKKKQTKKQKNKETKKKHTHIYLNIDTV